MYDEFEDDYLSHMDSCPECVTGRVIKTTKPYLKLFQGQLFTVPDALYYCCDLCEYQVVDNSTFNIVSHMMFSARVRASTDEKLPPLPSTYEEEALRKSDPSQL